MASSVSPLGVLLDAVESKSLNSKLLKPLDEVLRCHICFDYFTNCMITKCSHNYCSLCIRRYMAYKPQCPICLKPASEPELQNNRLIDEVLRLYKKMRESLELPFETIDSIKFDLPSSSKGGCYEKVSKIDASISVQNSQLVEKKITEKNTRDEVSCPVCYNTIRSDRINSHLDNCLKQSAERNVKKSLPKLVYHLLNDKQIKKILHNQGLNTAGDRQALIRRHKNFVLLYNANCDSLTPKPVSDLLLEIERQELEEKIHAIPKTNTINRRSDLSMIEQENENYVQEHKSQFNALMMDVHQREISKTIIKKEVDECEAFMTCSRFDNSGKIEERSPQTVPNFEIVAVKQELSDSPPSTESVNDSSDSEENELKQHVSAKPQQELAESTTESSDSEKDVPKQKVSAKPKQESVKTPSIKSRKQPFPKKAVLIKMKSDSASQFDIFNEDSSDSLSSSDDPTVQKIQTRSALKKKNARKLSVGDSNGSQRKK